jgi:hypothetical protein
VRALSGGRGFAAAEDAAGLRRTLFRRFEAEHRALLEDFLARGRVAFVADLVALVDASFFFLGMAEARERAAVRRALFVRAAGSALRLTARAAVGFAAATGSAAGSSGSSGSSGATFAVLVGLDAKGDALHEALGARDRVPDVA